MRGLYGVGVGILGWCHHFSLISVSVLSWDYLEGEHSFSQELVGFETMVEVR